MPSDLLYHRKRGELVGAPAGNVIGTAGSLSITLPAGYYDGTKTATANDSNLTADNILLGKTIFGVSGTVIAAPTACTANNQTNCVTNASYVAGAPAGNVIGAAGSLSITLPAGYYDGTKTATATDSNLLAANVCSGKTLFGTAGSATCGAGVVLASNALRDPGTVPVPYFAGRSTSNQLTLFAEINTYGQVSGGALLPSTGGYNYRDIPSNATDDDGYTGTSVKYALRPQTACGSSGTISDRILDCANKNPSRSSWDGSVNGNAGQALWKLVYSTGQATPDQCNGGSSLVGTDCKEVWQDTRTGLIWSSLANGTVTASNWCQASGNTECSCYTH